MFCCWAEVPCLQCVMKGVFPLRLIASFSEVCSELGTPLSPFRMTLEMVLMRWRKMSRS